jgi:hypothetical protein
MIKKFHQLNENISDIFNIEYSYKDKVRNSLYNIIENEHKISEKDFKRIDNMMKIIKDLFEKNEFIKTTVEEFKNKRSEYAAEYIYDILKDNALKINF